MSVTLHNMAGRSAPTQGFSHATVASGSRIVHISGQVGADASGTIAAGLAAQTEQALHRVALALDAAGATIDDLARMRFYVVDWDVSMADDLNRGRDAARQTHPFPDVALTLIGVTSLFTSEMLIEIDAVAVLDS